MGAKKEEREVKGLRREGKKHEITVTKNTCNEVRTVNIINIQYFPG